MNLAFIHRSYSNEYSQKIENNEKLEFLGDSVLGMVTADYLFNRLPDRVEGYLAKVKSFVVSEESLDSIARSIDVDKYLLIGKGEENSGGRQKKAILADCMEAIIGAYYLDTGYREVSKFVLRFLVPQIDKVLENRHKKDYKTMLQEYVQKKYHIYPKYTLVKKSGPDHDKTFWMEVSVNGRTFGPGEGKNKKEAEQQAAEEAFAYLSSTDSV
ncbi:ribonuclease-3 [Spirochaeta isovalerica]|uniref:Ribonuclease 3 n=1 Tax=Spirochaeta isovalerica TaxID=150 RepID=A0A841R7U7_9SPIO|nr:ribonuclease-3 [Spirochaeta isovalerica]